MASSHLLYLFVLACSLQYVYSLETVPVYMWGDLESSSQKANPLNEITEKEFDAVVKQQLEDDPFTVVFIEENLSVEDFSRRISGESCFPYLRSNLKDALYLPSVQSSANVLDKLADPETVDHVKLTENGLSAEIKSEDGKYLFINLKDAKEGESREEMLRRHNNFIEDMFAKLQERYDKLVGIYTAYFPSWTVPVTHSRVRRQAVGVDGTVLSFEHALFYVNNVSVVEDNNVVQLTGLTEGTSAVTENGIEATIKSPENSIKLLFSQAGGYWFLNRAELQDSSNAVYQLASEGASAIQGFSYRCSQSVSFTSYNTTKKYVVHFHDFQIQPFFGPNSTGFGEPYFCVGFTSVPIWAGLFVVAILLSIMFYGVIMMMDIRTMDRFDDPKGKTITISAME